MKLVILLLLNSLRGGNLAITTEQKYKIQIDKAIKAFIKESAKGNNTTQTFLKNIIEHIPEWSDKLNTMSNYIKLEQITKNLLEKVKSHLNVENLPIPTIVFTGEIEELATVFENLNKGGKKLSKYQVFAAQWSRHEVKLSEDIINSRILEITIERYENLIETRNVEINNFNREEMLENRVINIAELCYAIGYLILEQMSVFWDKNSEDVANQIGYSTLSIIFGIKNKDMSKLENYFDKLDNAQVIEEFTQEILKIYKDINNRFAKIFQVPGFDKNIYYGQKTASDFQLLSFFGSLWVTKFENLQSGKLIRRQKYNVNYKIIENNLVKYFIYDVVQGRWSGSGDSRLDSIVIDGEIYYLSNIEKERFENVLVNWHEELVNKSSIRFEPVSKMLYTILSSFYPQYYNEKKYDSEHVVSYHAINKIRKKSNISIPGGAIGNHMYLSMASNRSKKEFSLYDIKKEGFEIKEEFINYQAYPSEDQFSKIYFEFERENGDYEAIVNTITKRGQYLITDLVNKMFD